MNHVRENFIVWVAGLAMACTVFIAGCDNMQHQAQREVSTVTPRPDGTVARGQVAPDDPFVTGFQNGVPLKHAPIPFTPATLARGRDRFNIYCAVCHGADGYGTGIVVRRGFPAPPSYHDDRLRNEPDGHFFDVMTRGYGVMLAYADRIPPGDRWAIVGYIRALQRSQRTTLADVPAPDRAHLEQP